jgi:Domain of unknown function (DUF397)
MDKEQLNWRKSQRSNGQGACVEVATTAPAVLVRDTTNRDGGTLAFTAQAWNAFAATIKNG